MYGKNSNCLLVIRYGGFFLIFLLLFVFFVMERIVILFWNVFGKIRWVLSY